MARRPDFPIKLPLGAKVPTTRFTPRPLVPIQPAGSVIADFAVIGRPVPWSVPPKVRRKKPKLKAWQRLVSDCALLAYGSPGLYAGPVSLRLEFYLRPRYASSDKGMPDLTNLIKGCEDALNRTVLVDDSQVVATTAWKIVGDEDYAHVAIYAAEGRRS